MPGAKDGMGRGMHILIWKLERRRILIWVLI
jgi:hypothetical protein